MSDETAEQWQGITYDHRLGLVQGHLEAVVLGPVARPGLLAVVVAASLHEILVELELVPEDSVAPVLDAVDGEGAVDAVLDGLVFGRGGRGGGREEDSGNAEETIHRGGGGGDGCWNGVIGDLRR